MTRKSYRFTRRQVERMLHEADRADPESPLAAWLTSALLPGIEWEGPDASVFLDLTPDNLYTLLRLMAD